MLTYHRLISALKYIGLRKDTPALTFFGSGIFEETQGGIATLMGALLSTVDNVMLPAFTYSTMVIPESGPEENLIDYGSGREANLEATIFSYTLPSEMGNQAAIDHLRNFPGVYRSSHPILSFYGLGLDIALIDHPPGKPYLPIQKMIDLDGWVILLGAKSSQNFAIHYAERLSGRKQFTRWALTPNGIAQCEHFPGCPDGFSKLNYYLHEDLHKVTLDEFTIQGVPVKILVETATALLKEDPFALLCNDLNCARCNIVRDDVRAQIAGNWEREHPGN